MTNAAAIATSFETYGGQILTGCGVVLGATIAIFALLAAWKILKRVLGRA